MPAPAATDAEVVAAAERAFAADPRSSSHSKADRLAAAAAAAGQAARATGATAREIVAVEQAVTRNFMSPYLLVGAAAELQQAFDRSAAKTGLLFAIEMLEGSGPERELLLRLQPRSTPPIGPTAFKCLDASARRAARGAPLRSLGPAACPLVAARDLALLPFFLFAHLCPQPL